MATCFITVGRHLLIQATSTRSQRYGRVKHTHTHYEWRKLLPTRTLEYSALRTWYPSLYGFQGVIPLGGSKVELIERGPKGCKFGLKVTHPDFLAGRALVLAAETADAQTQWKEALEDCSRVCVPFWLHPGWSCAIRVHFAVTA